MTTVPSVTIILLNWNGYEDTIEALESLYHINYPNYNVIVVDNASSNDSIEKIEQYAGGNLEFSSDYTSYTHDEVKLIKLSEDELDHSVNYTSTPDRRSCLLIENHDNYGFAKGNNIAIEYTLKYDQPDYILLLNNDTIVDENFLTYMVNVAEEDKQIALLGPKFYYYDYNGSHNTIWCIGSVVDLEHYPGHHSIMDEPENYDINQKIIECDWISGAGMLMRTSAIKKSGYLDTDFFFGCEDVDLAVRLKNLNYKIVTVSDAIIWHKVGMSRHKSSTFHTEFNHIKTNMAFIKKHKNNFYINTPRYVYQIGKLYAKALKDKL